MNDLSDRNVASAAGDIAALVARARIAQAVANEYNQARTDELVAAAGWAIIEPVRNRELAELAVSDTGMEMLTIRSEKTIARLSVCCGT